MCRRSVTRKYELLELEAEKAEDNLIAKQQQREQLVSIVMACTLWQFKIVFETALNMFASKFYV